jgi:protein-tyrosine-phosphatase
MGPEHLHRLRVLGAEEKAVILGVFATEESPAGVGNDGNSLAVPDPVGGGEEVYEETFLTLENFVELAMKRLAGGVGR